jgi:hypothetical protein
VQAAAQAVPKDIRKKPCVAFLSVCHRASLSHFYITAFGTEGKLAANYANSNPFNPWNPRLLIRFFATTGIQDSQVVDFVMECSVHLARSYRPKNTRAGMESDR